jgi:hypothetical protein
MSAGTLRYVRGRDSSLKGSALLVVQKRLSPQGSPSLFVQTRSLLERRALLAVQTRFPLERSAWYRPDLTEPVHAACMKLG